MPLMQTSGPSIAASLREEDAYHYFPSTQFPAASMLHAIHGTIGEPRVPATTSKNSSSKRPSSNVGARNSSGAASSSMSGSIGASIAVGGTAGMVATSGPISAIGRQVKQTREETQELLVCAGRSVSNNGGDNNFELVACGLVDDARDHLTPPDNLNLRLRFSRAGTVAAALHGAVSSLPGVYADGRGVAPTQLQRSDSELEQIISELREKVATQQRSDTKKLLPEVESNNGANDSTHAATHSRRHLKNPVERMSSATTATTTASTGTVSTATTGPPVPIKRQASMGSVPRTPSSDSTPKLATGASLLNCSALTASKAVLVPLASSSFAAAEAPSSARRSDEGSALDSDDDYGDTGFQIRSIPTDRNSQASMHFLSSTSLGLSSGPSTAHQNRANRLRYAASASIQASRRHNLRSRDKSNGEDRSGDHDHDRNNEDAETDDPGDDLSLSPVGPWVAEDNNFRDSTSPLSSHSPCDALAPAPASPRSRLLWFSDYGNRGGTSSTARLLAKYRPQSGGSGSRSSVSVSKKPLSAGPTPKQKEPKRKKSAGSSKPPLEAATSASRHGSGSAKNVAGGARSRTSAVAPTSQGAGSGVSNRPRTAQRTS